MYAFLFSIALFLALGIFLLTGRGSSLIVGFNKLSPEEKKKYDVTAMCRFLGLMSFAFAGSTGLVLLGFHFGLMVLAVAGSLLAAGTLGVIVFRFEKSNLFKK